MGDAGRDGITGCNFLVRPNAKIKAGMGGKREEYKMLQKPARLHNSAKHAYPFFTHPV